MSEKEGKAPPRIQVSHFPHSMIPTISEENLITGNEELPGGVSNPVFKVEEASGDNITSDSEYFSFDQDAVQRYKSQPRRGTFAGGTYPSNRILIPERRSSDDLHQKDYLLPDIQHTNNGISFTSDDLGDKVSNNWETFPSDGRLQALPTPGLLNINGYDKHPPPSPGLLSINSVWSELANSRRSSYTESNESSFRSGSISNLSSSLSEQLHYLVRAFSSRTERVKASTTVPLTPSTSPDLEFDGNSDALSAISNTEEPQQRTHRIDSFIPGHKPTPTGEPQEDPHYFRCGCCKSTKFHCKIPRVFEAQSKVYMSWLLLVTIIYMYNAIVIPLRAAFTTEFMDSSNWVYWMIADYFGDLIYLLDVLVFKPRLTYLVSGLSETDVTKTRKHYMKKNIFKFDVLSLMPLDIFYFITGVYGPSSMLRLPRLMKLQTVWEFYNRVDQAVRSAHILRILKTMTYMLILIHIETCGYYAISAYQGFGVDGWVYSGEGNAYIRCFYLAAKTATSIGNNPIPVNTLEYIFMTFYWLSGVFVFALLVGQIRDIVEQAQRIKTLYDKRMETALRYVKNLNLPKEMREKVRVWFIYNWQQQKILDEKALMDTLPIKLRTDLAIHVHFNTLSRVKLFQDCDKSLLYNLVLKLNPILFLPGEYVCRKGEVGREMYIVSQGIVEVVGGPDNSLVFATLKNGSVFGEISLLSIGTEGNRRTADVRVKGFTNLFILSKADFESAMTEYPAAHKLLKKRAKKLLRQNAKMQKKESESSLGDSRVNVEEIIHPPREQSKTPKLLQTVLQVMNPESYAVKKIGPSGDEIVSNQETNENNQLDKVYTNIIISDNGSQDNKIGQKDETNTTVINNQEKEELKHLDMKTDSKSLTAQEVEDFYDEILQATEGNPTTFEEAITGKRNPLKRDGTAHTEDSIDSGVHVHRVTSPSGSTKTFSNKDSKESFISSEDTDTIGQQKGKVATLAEFFEDSLSSEDNEISDTNINDNVHSQINQTVEEIPMQNEKSKQKITKHTKKKTAKKHSDESKIKTGNKTSKQHGKHQQKPKKDAKQNSNDTSKTAVQQIPEKSLGLLDKPGSKRPKFMGIKSLVRKIAPEIQVDGDHLTKPNMSDQNQKTTDKKMQQTVRSVSPAEKWAGLQAIGKTSKENLFPIEDDQLEKDISEILEENQITSMNTGLRPMSKEKDDEKKTIHNLSHERRLSKIEASISSLTSDIEKADALLRELCSDDDIDVDKEFVQNDKADKSDHSKGNGENNIHDQYKNGTEREKKNESYTIPVKNQITCSVEVHREKSLTPLDIRGDIITPISLTEWIENANETLRRRKESSASSIFHETGV